MNGMVVKAYGRMQGREVKMIDQDQRECRLSQVFFFAEDTAMGTEPNEQVQSVLTDFGKACERKKMKANMD